MRSQYYAEHVIFASTKTSEEIAGSIPPAWEGCLKLEIPLDTTRLLPYFKMAMQS